MFTRKKIKFKQLGFELLISIMLSLSLFFVYIALISGGVNVSKMKADYFYTQKQYDKAIPSYQKYLQTCPTDYSAQLRLANSFYFSNNFEMSLEMYALLGEGTQKEEITACIFYNMANAYFKLKMFNNAVEFYKKHLLEYPTDFDARYNLELIYFLASVDYVAGVDMINARGSVPLENVTELVRQQVFQNKTELRELISDLLMNNMMEQLLNAVDKDSYLAPNNESDFLHDFEEADESLLELKSEVEDIYTDHSSLMEEYIDSAEDLFLGDSKSDLMESVAEQTVPTQTIQEKLELESKHQEENSNSNRAQEDVRKEQVDLPSAENEPRAQEDVRKEQADSPSAANESSVKKKDTSEEQADESQSRENEPRAQEDVRAEQADLPSAANEPSVEQNSGNDEGNDDRYDEDGTEGAGSGVLNSGFKGVPLSIKTDGAMSGGTGTNFNNEKIENQSSTDVNDAKLDFGKESNNSGSLIRSGSDSKDNFSHYPFAANQENLTTKSVNSNEISLHYKQADNVNKINSLNFQNEKNNAKSSVLSKNDKTSGLKKTGTRSFSSSRGGTIKKVQSLEQIKADMALKHADSIDQLNGVYEQLKTNNDTRDRNFIQLMETVEVMLKKQKNNADKQVDLIQHEQDNPMSDGFSKKKLALRHNEENAAFVTKKNETLQQIFASQFIDQKTDDVKSDDILNKKNRLITELNKMLYTQQKLLAKKQDYEKRMLDTMHEPISNNDKKNNNLPDQNKINELVNTVQEIEKEMLQNEQAINHSIRQNTVAKDDLSAKQVGTQQLQEIKDQIISEQNKILLENSKQGLLRESQDNDLILSTAESFQMPKEQDNENTLAKLDNDDVVDEKKVKSGDKNDAQSFIEAVDDLRYAFLKQQLESMHTLEKTLNQAEITDPSDAEKCTQQLQKIKDKIISQQIHFAFSVMNNQNLRDQTDIEQFINNTEKIVEKNLQELDDMLQKATLEFGKDVQAAEPNQGVLGEKQETHLSSSTESVGKGEAAQLKKVRRVGGQGVDNNNDSDQENNTSTDEDALSLLLALKELEEKHINLRKPPVNEFNKDNQKGIGNEVKNW
jgi:hypothetical protein